MSTSVFLKRITEIHTLIQNESTGPCLELAQQLGISVATLHNTINFMKDEFEAPIKYDRARQTYYYTFKGILDLKFRKYEDINVALNVLQRFIQQEPSHFNP